MGFAHQRPDGTMVALPSAARASVGALLPAGAGAAASVPFARTGAGPATTAPAAPGAVSAAGAIPAPGAVSAGGAPVPKGSLFKLLLFIISKVTVHVPLLLRSRHLGDSKVNAGHSVADRSVVDLKDLG